jgi:hypothetical protein
MGTSTLLELDRSSAYSKGSSIVIPVILSEAKNLKPTEDSSLRSE